MTYIQRVVTMKDYDKAVKNDIMRKRDYERCTENVLGPSNEEQEHESSTKDVVTMFTPWISWEL
jgi:hypothetical protein